MGQAKQKQRDCPVAGHVISSTECGENRASRYSCPVGCPHNPWTPANYGRAQEIEDGLTGKLFRRLEKDGLNIRDAVLSCHGNDVALQKLIVKHAYQNRDAAGKTLVQLWEQDRWDGLNNDERVLIGCLSRMRIALIEIRRVLNDQQCEAVDLFDPSGVPFVIHDRSLASMAVRFYQMLAWSFPMPHYHRMHGVALTVPEVNDFDAVSVVKEVVAHLGGPTENEALHAWLADNIDRVGDAFHETIQAMHQRMMESMDARYIKTTYRLHCAPAEVLKRLDSLPSIEPEELTEEDVAAGFTDIRQWFDEASPMDDKQMALPLPSGPRITGRPSLGSVKVSSDRVCIETCTGSRHQSLRAQFERLMGRLIEFREERADDIAAQVSKNKKPINAKLVPPRLLENAPRIILQSSKITELPPGLSKDELNRYLARRNMEAFLEDSIPLLGNMTPRQAATDPKFRPKLVELMKKHVRRNDEENLRTGRNDDINWLLRELGLTEILFEAPPPRAVLSNQAGRTTQEGFPDEDDFGDEDSEIEDVPPPPRNRPMSDNEVVERLNWCREQFPTPDEILDEFEIDAYDLHRELDLFTENLLNDAEWAVLETQVAQAWFVLFPNFPPEELFEPARLLTAVQEEVRGFGQLSAERTARKFIKHLESGRQPALTSILASVMIDTMLNEATNIDVRPETGFLSALILKATVDELDRWRCEAQ